MVFSFLGQKGVGDGSRRGLTVHAYSLLLFFRRHQLVRVLRSDRGDRLDVPDVVVRLTLCLSLLQEAPTRTQL